MLLGVLPVDFQYWAFALLLEPLATLVQSATQFQNSLSGLDRVLDLLGEAVISEPEAERYCAAYLELINGLAPKVHTWAENKLTLGFAQVGAESEWRTANTASVKDAAKQAGITLKFADAQQKQENQVKAIRSFIAQKVDVIAFSPVVESGWDTVLREAKAAKIPVILEDRTTSSPDTLFASWVGDDFKAEGETAGKFAAENYGNTPTKMVVLEGTTGSAPANDRAAGFDDAIKGTQITKIDSQTGDFTRDGGKSVMEGFIQKYGIDGIDLVFAHNDEEAIGAIQAIKEAGLVPGKDIQVIGVDATADGFKYMIDGTLNADIECNPLLAPQVYEAALAGLNGATDLPKWVPSQEGQFFAAQGADALKAILATRKY